MKEDTLLKATLTEEIFGIVPLLRSDLQPFEKIDTAHSYMQHSAFGNSTINSYPGDKADPKIALASLYLTTLDFFNFSKTAYH
jgi:hypothetical protein